MCLRRLNGSPMILCWIFCTNACCLFSLSRVLLITLICLQHVFLEGSFLIPNALHEKHPSAVKRCTCTPGYAPPRLLRPRRPVYIPSTALLQEDKQANKLLEGPQPPKRLCVSTSCKHTHHQTVTSSSETAAHTPLWSSCRLMNLPGGSVEGVR